MNKIITFMNITVMNYIINPLCQQTFVFYFFWSRYYDWWCRKYKSKQNMLLRKTQGLPCQYSGWDSVLPSQGARFKPWLGN